jgi:hypothetical protein
LSRRGYPPEGEAMSANRPENLRRALKFLKHETMTMEDEIAALKRELATSRDEVMRYKILCDHLARKLEEPSYDPTPVMFEKAKS